MLLSTKLGEPLSLSGLRLKNRVFLAPMSGITDAPFRARAVASGAGLAFAEMIASGELRKGRAGSLKRLAAAGAGPLAIQLAGRTASDMAEAARIAEGEGADLIDINMGCPAKKVTGGYCGSTLMRDLDHAVSLIDAVVGAVGVPVTVKMRLGWDESALNAPVLARRAEEAGVRMVTVHGRTREQFYTGRADWRAIARVKQAVSIPVVANGDVQSLADAQSILDASGADAVMIARGHYGRPWLAGSIAAQAGGKAGFEPTAGELADYVRGHYEDMLSHYGVESGLRQARKHLGWYLDRHADVLPLERKAILTGIDPKLVASTLVGLFDRGAQMRDCA